MRHVDDRAHATAEERAAGRQPVEHLDDPADVPLERVPDRDGR